MAVDNLSINIEGCRYLSSSWTDTPVSLLTNANTALQGVSNLNFDKVAAINNRIGSFGLFVTSPTYGVTNKKYLTQAEMTDLKNSITSALLGVSNFTFAIVSISCSRNDEVMGVA